MLCMCEGCINRDGCEWEEPCESYVLDNNPPALMSMAEALAEIERLKAANELLEGMLQAGIDEDAGWQ